MWDPLVRIMRDIMMEMPYFGYIYIYLWVGGKRRDKEIIPIRLSQPNLLILNLHFKKNKIQSNSESIPTWHSGRCTLLQPQRYGFKSRYPERIN